jgi:hypothetical protein
MNTRDDDVARLRVPPHSEEAEQSVLGALLLDNAAMGRVSDLLRADDFYRHQHATIYAAISTMLDEHQVVDIVTLHEKLDAAGQATHCGGMAYLNSLAQSVPSAASIRQYAEIVRSRAILRRVISMTDEIATMAFNGTSVPVETLLSDVEEKFAELQREQQRKIPDRRVPLLRLDALQEASHSVRWLIKHVVPAESLGMLFGGSGTFKSFIALDAGLHVAHGLPWLGRRTNKGSVMYIAAEGGTGLWPRIDAWHRARNLRWTGLPFTVVPVSVDLGTEAWRVVDAAQAIGQTPSLVIIDTLSQTFSGEENSAAEMAAYLRQLGARFRALWNCAVLVIHHSGHLATERPRGSSVIRGNVDFLMGVFRDEKEMLATVSCSKQKDGDTFDDVTFSLSKFRLGTDEDGDEVTSLVARHLTSAEEVEEAMRVEAKAGRVGKNQLLLSLVQNGMRESDLRKVFADECGIENPESRKRVFNRAKAWAMQHGYIEVAAGIVITLKKD